jgi:hypothetical protein
MATEKPTISQTIKQGIALMPSLKAAQAKATETKAQAGPAVEMPSYEIAKVAQSAKAKPAPFKPEPATAYADGSLLITLPAELWAKLAKPVVGQGGWQTMQSTLQAALHHGGDNGIMITPGMFNKLVAMSVKYGGGGYQTITRHLVCLYIAAKEGI